ncbi:PilT/PilU family type 4a pilus ATPase [Candidatus Sumerlaeota bacterium]|nr:PilT/PilU family type 4a pilus ATPase [Candidatus Sumerlaeota bacterium]
MNLRTLLEGMTKVEASDLHLKAGGAPTLRIHAGLRQINHPPLTADEIRQTLDEILPAKFRDRLETQGAVDFSYSIAGLARFRVAAFHQRGAVSLAFRRVNTDVPAIETLNLPEAAMKLTASIRGMTLVTGVTGSGKSTTLAAMIQQINSAYHAHIVTLEDPIEYLFTDQKCIINQIEVGLDCPSFRSMMTHVVRFDPNIIMIGEMRDRETIESALEAADTGHMVLSTLHTSDAKQTITRILNFFPREDEKLILEQLAMNLHAIVSQRLLPRTDIKGLIPAVELLINTPIVTKLIKDGRIADLQQVLTNREGGMQSFDVSLGLLVRESKISEQTAARHCADESFLRRFIRGGSSVGDQAGLIGGGGY